MKELIIQKQTINHEKINIDKQVDIILSQLDISFKAKGVFLTLLNKYGKIFQISRTEISKLSNKDKYIAIYSAIKELEKAGLLKRVYFGKIRKIKFILTLEN